LECHEGAFGFPSRVSHPLKASWQKQVLASIGYRDLGMFEDAAHALEEIEPDQFDSLQFQVHQGPRNAAVRGKLR
jgi:hypothetical protein